MADKIPQYYLTTKLDKDGRGILAVISLGSPQRGDKDVTICDVEICATQKEAEDWYERQMKTKPWVDR